MQHDTFRSLLSIFVSELQPFGTATCLHVLCSWYCTSVYSGRYLLLFVHFTWPLCIVIPVCSLPAPACRPALLAAGDSTSSAGKEPVALATCAT